MNFKVLYDKDYIKKRLPTEWSLQFDDFDFEKISFKDVPMFKDDGGNFIIDIRWALSKLDTIKYDGIILCPDGDKLKGVWGKHNGLWIGNKKISIIQVECQENIYRDWEKDGLFWKLEKSKKKTEYPQIEYTFNHELCHAHSWLENQKDLLHLFVKTKQYNYYIKNYIAFKKKEQNDLLPLVKRKWKALQFIMSFQDPIVLVEGYRGCELQEKYFAEGKSNAKCGESMHQYGVAIDFKFKKEPYWPNEKTTEGLKRWGRVLKVAEWLGFESYGLKYNWDYGHIQLLLDYNEKDFVNKKVPFNRYD